MILDEMSNYDIMEAITRKGEVHLSRVRKLGELIYQAGVVEGRTQQIEIFNRMAEKEESK